MENSAAMSAKAPKQYAKKPSQISRSVQPESQPAPTASENPVALQPLTPDKTLARLEHIKNPAARQQAFRDLSQQHGNQYAATVARSLVQRAPAAPAPAPAQAPAAPELPALGTWTNPLPGYAGKSCDFGWRYRHFAANPKWQYHQGIDIFKGGSATVVAANSGIAQVLPNNGAGGNSIRIKHAGGVTTIYCHLASFKISNGDEVEAGDEIGVEGNTGTSSTGIHLHFGAKSDGTDVDPAPYSGGIYGSADSNLQFRDYYADKGWLTANVANPQTTNDQKARNGLVKALATTGYDHSLDDMMVQAGLITANGEAQTANPTPATTNTNNNTNANASTAATPAPQGLDKDAAKLTAAKEAIVKGLNEGAKDLALVDKAFYAAHPTMVGKSIGSLPKNSAARKQMQADYLFIRDVLIAQVKEEIAKKAAQPAAEADKPTRIWGYELSMSGAAQAMSDGYTSVAGAASSGYEKVSSAVSSGYQTVADTAESGYNAVTGAAASAWHSVTDLFTSDEPSVTAPKPAAKPATAATANPKAALKDTSSLGAAASWRAVLQAGGDAADELIENVERNREALEAIQKVEDSQKDYKGTTGFMYLPKQSQAEKDFSAGKSGKSSDGTTTTAADIVWEEIASEGSANSINTYDGQGMTWGRGFAGGGMLGDLIVRFCNSVPGMRAKFNAIGIDVEDSVIYTLDTENRKVVKGKDGLHALKDDAKIASFFVNQGNAHPEALVKAQYDQAANAKRGAANVPEWAAGWDKAMLQFVGHCAHWLSSAFRWDIWKDTNGDPAQILKVYATVLYKNFKPSLIIEQSSTQAWIIKDANSWQGANYVLNPEKSWYSAMSGVLGEAVTVIPNGARLWVQVPDTQTYRPL
jgi:murein DD-endopeptidase MepM/ murein hydrolase activator NlpD